MFYVSILQMIPVWFPHNCSWSWNEVMKRIWQMLPTQCCSCKQGGGARWFFIFWNWQMFPVDPMVCNSFKVLEFNNIQSTVVYNVWFYLEKWFLMSDLEKWSNGIKDGFKICFWLQLAFYAALPDLSLGHLLMDVCMWNSSQLLVYLTIYFKWPNYH